MRKNSIFIIGAPVMVIAFGLLMAACGGKTQTRDAAESGSTESGDSSSGGYKRAKGDGIWTVDDPDYSYYILYIAGRAFIFWYDEPQIIAQELTPDRLKINKMTNFQADDSSISFTLDGKSLTFTQQEAGKKGAFDGIWGGIYNGKSLTSAFLDYMGITVLNDAGWAYPPFDGNGGQVRIAGNDTDFFLSLTNDVLTLTLGKDQYEFTPGQWDAAAAEKSWNAYVASIKNPADANPADDFGYGLTADGKGIVIKDYSGTGSDIVVPAKIEDMLVLEIAQDAFNGASPGGDTNENQKITSITLPDTVKHIGAEAFANLFNLTSAQLPDGLREIPSSLFSNCTKLKKVNLPQSLGVISYRAFLGCTELKDLVIPGSIRAVRWITDEDDNYAFVGCTKLPRKTRQAILSLGYESGF